MTPATFPEAGVTQVTVAATLAPDPATGDQPLRQGEARRHRRHPAAAATVTMTAGQQLQVNVTRAREEAVRARPDLCTRASS